jgi:hypothetical protein
LAALAAEVIVQQQVMLSPAAEARFVLFGEEIENILIMQLMFFYYNVE